MTEKNISAPEDILEDNKQASRDENEFITKTHSTLDDDKLSTDEAALLGLMAVNEDGTPLIKDYIAYAGENLPEGAEYASREAIIEALKTVSDPEIMINIWDLGLIYKIEQKENGDVYIEMTVTAPTCPVAGILPQQAADAVSKVDGIGKVEVKIVWEPAWTFENLSDEAKALFELF